MQNKIIPFIPEGADLTESILINQETEFRKVLFDLLQKVKESNVIMRLIGSLAFRLKCPDYKFMEYSNQRYLTDLDFVVYARDIVKVQDLFLELGWEENQTVLRLFGDKRRIFYHPSRPIHTDIFINKLRFCHEIDFRKRLEIDDITISLIDLLLEKLQIVEINKKDLVDIMMLISQYPISEDGETRNSIDGVYLAKICSKDWGWWRTVTMNIKKVFKFSDEYLDQEHADLVKEKLNILSDLIESKPKTLNWKLRALIGDRKRWYQEVEEIDRD